MGRKLEGKNMKKKEWFVLFLREGQLKTSELMTKQCAKDIFDAIDDSLFIAKIKRRGFRVYNFEVHKKLKYLLEGKNEI